MRITTVSTLTLLILAVSPGCRLGNRTEPAASNAPSTSTAAFTPGEYATQAKSLKACVGTGTQDPVCQDAEVSLIPPLVSNTFTASVTLSISDPQTGKGSVIGSNKQGLPLYIDPTNGEVGYKGQTNPATLWLDEGCQTQLELREVGKVSSSTRRLALTVQVVQVWDGNCEASLDAIAACYQDQGQCGGANAAENEALQQEVRVTFAPYIESKMVTLSQLKTLNLIGYVVTYE